MFRLILTVLNRDYNRSTRIPIQQLLVYRKGNIPTFRVYRAYKV